MVPIIYKTLYFIEDSLLRKPYLPTSDFGDNTIGTFLVASVADFDQRPIRLRAVSTALLSIRIGSR